MSPRLTGILAMIAGVALAIFGGTLFQYGWPGILGAILIVGASILFAVGAVWTGRKSWADKSWPPDVPVDPAKALRFQRRAVKMRFWVGALLIVSSVPVMVIDQSVWPGAIVALFGVWQLIFGVILHRSMKHPPKDNFWVP